MKTGDRAEGSTTARRLVRFLPAILAVLVIALGTTLHVLTNPDDTRPHAKVGAVFVHPETLVAPDHAGQVFLPWTGLEVAVGRPEDELPRLSGGRANLQAPEGGSFVQVGTRIHSPRPIVAIATPFATKVDVVLRADGKDYPLSGPDGLLLDPNGPNKDGNRWVAVEGYPDDIEVRVSFAGESQVVSTDGSVDPGGAAEGVRVPSTKDLRDFEDVPCGKHRTVGDSPLTIAYPDLLECLVTLAVRMPYVDGLGWAEPGREFLVIEVRTPFEIPVTSADQPREHFWEERYTLSATLGGKPTAADPADVSSLPTGAVVNGGGTQLIFEVERGTPAGELNLTAEVRAQLSDPFDARSAGLTLAWTIPGRKLA